MFKPEKILVPTDFSENDDMCSIMAVKQAVGIATQFNSELVLLHVVTEELSKMPLFFLDDEKIDGLQDKMNEHARHLLEAIKEKHIPDSLKVTLKIRQGVAYDEILKEVKESTIDLITISSRGHSTLTDFFYGSTTERVVRRATCSVLVVRKIIDR